MLDAKGPVELYRRYRPQNFSEVVGQEDVVHSLQRLLQDQKLPHTLLLSGPSGTGKTTIAYILGRSLGCAAHDFTDVNCAIVEGAIEMVRELRRSCQHPPRGGTCCVWLLDEVQSLSRTKFAQQAMLKLLEDVPSHIYYILATTDPAKILPAIRSRATEFKLKPLKNDDLHSIIETILLREERTLSGGVATRLVDFANGSAREAVKLLHQLIDLPTVEEQLASLTPVAAEVDAYKLCQAFLNERKHWRDIAAILREIVGDPDDIRRSVLNYAMTALLNGNHTTRCAIILDVFDCNFADSGKAGLVRASYTVFGRK